MSQERPKENSELLIVGVVSVQWFVLQAVEVPPGTPARHRPDRPPHSALETAAKPPLEETGTNPPPEAPTGGS